MSDAALQLAEKLIAARRDPARRLASLDDALIPPDLAAAYKVQQAVAATFGPIGGWKVGIPGGTKMCGALPASGVAASPARLPAISHPYRGIEAEIAFRVGSDLPPRDTPYSRDEVIAALATLHPAIEELESRFVDPDQHGLVTQLADTQSHGGFIFGPGTANWRRLDLTTMKCEQYVDGKLTKECTGYPFGDIVALVEWLANTGSVWAGGLKAGQFVTCGSWTGKECVGPTSAVRVAFSGLGEALLSYA